MGGMRFLGGDSAYHYSRRNCGVTTMTHNFPQAVVKEWVKYKDGGGYILIAFTGDAISVETTIYLNDMELDRIDAARKAWFAAKEAKGDK